MIKFINISKQKPYQLFKKYYDQALKNKQKIIEGIAISSFNKDLDQVNSRYVNLKYIKYDEWIFFGVHRFKFYNKLFIIYNVLYNFL